MSATPREIGTLIVVVLRANHLPNKRHIGKQDPYCVVTLNGERRRTKAIKRGGQHPEWDEEIRFTLFEDVEDLLARTTMESDIPPPPPPKDDSLLNRVKGGKTLKLACYADDFREPDLIGEAYVDLTEVLTKGETDDWFTLMNKDKFAGKVYLELTFYSNEPPPVKKNTPKAQATNKVYGGPGSFTPTGTSAAPSQTQGHRIASASSIYDHSQQNHDTIPSSLRASHTLARLDVYVPPSNNKGYASAVERVTNEFAEFGVQEPQRRRESLPPIPTYSTHQNYGYSYDPAGTVVRSDPSAYPQYTTTYEGNPAPTYRARAPRHSVPTSSSGFIPLPSSASVVAPQSDISTVQPQITQIPKGYLTTQYTGQASTLPIPPPTPYTPTPTPYQPSSTPSPYITQPNYTSPQQYQYPQYTVSSVPNAQYVDSQPLEQTSAAAPTSGQPVYQSYTATPFHDAAVHSRPLPQPQATPQVFPPPPPPPPKLSPTPYSIPVSTSVPPQTRSYSPTHPTGGFATSISYSSIPPPPSLPPPPVTPPRQNTGNPPNLPPPLTQGSVLTPSPHRQATLPQPPTNYQQPHAYNQDYIPPQPLQPFVPPPPPPPLNLPHTPHSPSPTYHYENPPSQTNENSQWPLIGPGAPPVQHNSYAHLPI
ncbi:hypothetical protein AX16_000239 [Volvariella volvacea WC 439]|nr:hypothetical protein AX16_000239 [Volvariella volvacea WC 439]